MRLTMENLAALDGDHDLYFPLDDEARRDAQRRVGAYADITIKEFDDDTREYVTTTGDRFSIYEGLDGEEWYELAGTYLAIGYNWYDHLCLIQGDDDGGDGRTWEFVQKHLPPEILNSTEWVVGIRD